jgi:hypothetical protein
MFTLENTEGFTQSDCDLMNEALRKLLEDGVCESSASDIVNNNWMKTNNTVDSLTKR